MPTTRFSGRNRCPICGGSNSDVRGVGVRCHGFLSDDGQWAHCTREEYAGPLPRHANSQTFSHRLTGGCGCGATHDPETALLQQRRTEMRAHLWHQRHPWEQSGEPTETIEYEVRNAATHLIAVHVRQNVSNGEKRFWWRLPDGTMGLNGIRSASLPLYGVHELPEDPTQPIFLVEGEKARDALKARGFAAVGTVTGAPHCPDDEVFRPLVGRRVIRWPDNDVQGRGQTSKAAEAIARVGGTSVELTWPEAPGGGDAYDFFAGSGTAERLREMVAALPYDDCHPLGRLSFDLNAVQLREIRDGLVARLLAGNHPPSLFARGDALARVDVLAGHPKLAVLGPDDMRNLMTDVADFVRRGRTVMAASPPSDAARAILAHQPGVKQFPSLDRIVEVPVFAPSGEFITEPGYHPSSQTFYHPATEPAWPWRPAGPLWVPPVPPEPSDDDLVWATTLIYQVIRDFPFVSEAERAHAVGLFLLPFVRNLIDGPTPLHLSEAPGPGTGKSLLVECLLLPALGRFPARVTEARDEDEWRKKLFALVVEGHAAVLIDNLHAQLRSAALSAWVEASEIQDRVLGHSKTLTVPNRAVWIATGNNPSVHEDLVRRTVRIRTDAQQEDPTRREHFHYDPLRTFVREVRGQLVWAAGVLTRAWWTRGRPKGRPVLRSFEAWSEVIGGILEVAGIRGFLGNRQEWSALNADPTLAGLHEFVEAWYRARQDRESSARDLQPITEHVELGFKGSTERARQTELGLFLAQYRDRRVGDYFVRGRRDGHTKVMRWRLERVRLVVAKRPVTD